LIALTVVAGWFTYLGSGPAFAGPKDPKGDHLLLSEEHARLLSELLGRPSLNEFIDEIRKLLVDLLKPDLVVLSLAPGAVSPPLLFCDQVGLTLELRVTLENQGHLTAPVNTTRITFDTPDGPEDKFLMFGSLATGAMETLSTDMPVGCFADDTSCSFEIFADESDTIAELVESNNVAVGNCPAIS
jgi:hypothetical protein